MPADTTPTDVYREIQSLAHDIEHIRVYMGWLVNTQTPIDVSGVAHAKSFTRQPDTDSKNVRLPAQVDVSLKSIKT